MEDLKDLLTLAFRKNASDIHITVGSVPIFRIDGRLIPHKGEVLSPTDTKRLARSIVTDDMWDKFIREKELDLSHGIEGSRAFVSTCFISATISRLLLGLFRPLFRKLMTYSYQAC